MRRRGLVVDVIDLVNVGIDTKVILQLVGTGVDHVTCCSSGLTSNMNWLVYDAYIHSDHLVVHYSIDYRNIRQQVEEATTRL